MREAKKQFLEKEEQQKLELNEKFELEQRELNDRIMRISM